MMVSGATQSLQREWVFWLTIKTALDAMGKQEKDCAKENGVLRSEFICKYLVLPSCVHTFKLRTYWGIW